MASQITIGKWGSDPGDFNDNRGVAVSAGNEIFVADLYNGRIQVFSMMGIYLRLFPTVVPGKDKETMLPSDVAIDGEGNLWVVGTLYKNVRHFVHVVQYSRDGLPAITFGVSSSDWETSIAFELRNNKVIVMVTPNILVFHPNGSLQQAFKNCQGGILSFVASDDKGSIFVTDRSHSVGVYDLSGQLLSKFRSFERGQCQLCHPQGIFVDTSGHIIVSNQDKHRVDMFTSRGEFVRTVVNITYPSGIAMGPDGQLVVCNQVHDTLTIFPRRMVFP
ncbi:tripartite motif-containing protein 3-like [Branchiostoma lanceolatum]|uniref:tripartite motif-containing protein 3-like n=1 Tax=Branchiostoma lanceolatum TaxID=7740 RepID=UPI003456C77D